MVDLFVQEGTLNCHCHKTACLRVTSVLLINLLQNSVCVAFEFFIHFYQYIHSSIQAVSFWIGLLYECNRFCIRQPQIQLRNSVKDVCGIRSVFNVNEHQFSHKMIEIIIPAWVSGRRNEMACIEVHSTANGPVKGFNKCQFCFHYLCIKLICDW